MSLCFSSVCKCFSFVFLMLLLCLLCRAVSWHVVPCPVVLCRAMSYRVVPLLQPPLRQILSQPISTKPGLDTLSVVVLPWRFRDTSVMLPCISVAKINASVCFRETSVCFRSLRKNYEMQDKIMLEAAQHDFMLLPWKLPFAAVMQAKWTKIITKTY